MFVVQNIPQDALLALTGTVTSPAQFISYASTSMRTPSDSLEVVWRPNADADFPRKEGQLSFASAFPALQNSAVDTPFVVGIPGAAATVQSNQSTSGECSGFGIAYTGLGSGSVTDIYIELTKIVQIRYRPVAGRVETIAPIPRSRLTTSAEAAMDLDRRYGHSWTVRSVVDGVVGSMGTAADVILGGASFLQQANTLYRNPSTQRRLRALRE
jgi:hypothetical protein